MSERVPINPWNAEKLSALDLARVKIIRDNAQRKGAIELVAMCDAQIAERQPVRPPRARNAAEAETGDLVIEYHFVCRNDRGVTFNPDGTFWSTSWVVGEDVLRKSLRYGPKLALHTSKTEPSYRQGKITDYRRVDDFADGKVESRIDFLVVPDNTPLDWAGAGTGEKGYKRVKSSGNAITTNLIDGE
ncbi:MULTISPECIES: hypothetical protein [unclassified Bradyrhizobium]|uniref:hypothetical protein n=1 Tax=unclassified Bradyrhizobium TaxID=2631580 RepID=UPI0028EFD572|nr:MULTISPECIES: hypothetical protein [unclassified Bradyrhizobium]